MPADLVSLVEHWTLYGEGCGFTNQLLHVNTLIRLCQLCDQYLAQPKLLHYWVVALNPHTKRKT